MMNSDEDKQVQLKKEEQPKRNPIRFYMTIGDIFSEGDRAKLEALIDEEKELLAHDLNLGLAKQLLKRLTQKNIENLSAIFV